MGTQTALIMIDLDKFKSANDIHGHIVGNQLLQRISKFFQERLLHIDTVARTGGDEFSIILECPDVREEAVKDSESLLAEVREPISLGSCLVHARFSLVIVLYPEDAEDAEKLYLAADTDRYRSISAMFSSQ